MKEIKEEYSPILEGTDIKDVKATVKNQQKRIRLKEDKLPNKPQESPKAKLKNITPTETLSN